MQAASKLHRSCVEDAAIGRGLGTNFHIGRRLLGPQELCACYCAVHCGVQSMLCSLVACSTVAP
eukprot:1311417-Pleurochrysis_carterae.AAC.3